MAIENRGPELLAVTVIMLVFSVVSIVLRVYVRLGMVKAFGLDDWFMVIATITHIMFATCVIGGIHYGTGRHLVDLDPENALRALRYWYFCYVAYCLTMIAGKISIGFFLLRLTVHKIHVYIIWSVMSLTVFTGAVFFFVTLFQCHPVQYFWTKAVAADGTCVNVEVIMGLTYLYGAISAICDFTFGILPIFLIWNLNMKQSVKMALVPILSMACIASSAVIVRMAYVKDFDSPDFLWATVDIAIWSDVEQGLAITAGSLATLRPLFRLVSVKFGSYPTTGRNTPSHNLTPAASKSGVLGNKPKTHWPTNNTANGGRSRPWSLLHTANDRDGDGDFEMTTKAGATVKVNAGEGRSDHSSSPSPPPTGIMKGSEVVITHEERIMEDVDLGSGGLGSDGQRKSWWRMAERDNQSRRSRSRQGDRESQEELTLAAESELRPGRGPKGDPGHYV